MPYIDRGRAQLLPSDAATVPAPAASLKSDDLTKPARRKSVEEKAVEAEPDIVLLQTSQITLDEEASSSGACGEEVAGVPLRGMQHEVYRVMRLAGPLSGKGVLTYSAALFSSGFVGRLGATPLSAWMLSRTLVNVTGHSLVWGVISAMETFCGQAFGAGRYALLGVILQRSLLICCAVATPCAIGWIWADKALVLLGQDTYLAAIAGRYIHFWTPALFLYSAEWICQLLLQAQGIVLPALCISAVHLPLTILFNWLFIFKLGFGLNGAAIAMCALGAVTLAMMVVYLMWDSYRRPPERKTWHGWSWEAWRGWGHYMHVALPSLAMICLDWWGSEITILLAGILPDPRVHVAAMGIALNTSTLFFMASHGLSGAASTRVSNELGANHPHRAKLVVEVAVGILVVLATLAACGLIAARHHWARLFTSDDEVAGLVGRLLVLVSATLLGDGIVAVLSGVLRAKTVARINCRPLPDQGELVTQVRNQLRADGQRVVVEALRLEAATRHKTPSGPAELSLVLCDDTHITALNHEWRGKDAPTDVLSFAMDAMPPGCPVRVLGDVIISLDTAYRQAQERRYTLLDECRVLLVHGVLHLLDFDHERGEKDAQDMAKAEQLILQALGWQGEGLITSIADGATDAGPAAPSSSATSREDDEDGGRSSSNGTASTSAPAAGPPLWHAGTKASRRPLSRQRTSDIRLLALDMDGTLLDSRSKVLPSSVKALKAAMKAGVMVCLATGKARPAAVAAMAAVGLAGEGLVVSPKGPGIFLQGLAVHGARGQLLPGKDMPPAVVAQAFKYSLEHDVPLSAFLGDECVTLKMAPELEELHTRYYEPLSRVAGSLEELLAGPPVKKLLFMTSPERVESLLKPHWKEAVKGQQAETMQAVETMLELVPEGVNKWSGMQRLMSELSLPVEAIMAVGDGSNDFPLVSNVGLGVAMGNAVPEVKKAAAVTVASNDENGIAEAIERFIL
ncbi:hypothetical protein WJX72_008996 [[Myrmecia] bisecta]|uniref:Protein DETOXIFICATION n=1 Tax=[Myrmecia] bisecta TaxID=41462 RepID=A0AAW1PGH9_9CHLO